MPAYEGIERRGDEGWSQTFHWRPSLQRWGAPVALFLLAFLPRAISPVSRAMLWYARAIRFSEAVLSGDLAATNIRHHPGVTVMWLSGLSLQVFARLRGLTSAHLQGLKATPPGVIEEAVAAGVLPLALTIALCIALSYGLIRRLAGRRVALVAACLLALDPFHLARSQVLHVDALLASFMLVSALFLLNHLHHGRGSDLILSGAFGGLAMLTKSPALYLVPYTALAVAAYRPTGLAPGPITWRPPVRRLCMVVRKLAPWTLVAAVIFVALWPAMWVTPVDVLARMTSGISTKLGEAHHNPTYLAGEIVDPFESPGPLFYLVTVGWKTTLVTLPMLVVAIVLALARLRFSSKESTIVLLLAAYAVFFTAQMCLGARKSSRYILPVFLALDVAAAFGIVWMAVAAGKAFGSRSVPWLPAAISGGLLLAQAGLTLPHHPYYGTLYNRLLGGARTAQHMLPLQQEGEGLDLAARYLNALPDAQGTYVGVDRNGSAMFGRTFLGTPTAIDDPGADYRVYYLNQVMRQLHLDEWGRLFALDRQNDPFYTVAFGGIPYVRAYRNEMDVFTLKEPHYEVPYRLGEHITLEGVTLSTGLVLPNEKLVVRPTWTSDGQVERSYKVFCHLLSPDQVLLAQRDDLPLGGSRPTSTWQRGEVIEDRYTLRLDRDAQPGDYELSLGMYDAETLERLPVHTADGERVLHNRIVLGTITVADVAW